MKNRHVVEMVITQHFSAGEVCAGAWTLMETKSNRKCTIAAKTLCLAMMNMKQFVLRSASDNDEFEILLNKYKCNVALLFRNYDTVRL